MRNRRYGDEVQVIETAPDWSPLAPVIFLVAIVVLTGLAILVWFAMKGDTIASLILGALGTMAIIWFTIKMTNSVRRTELEGRARIEAAGNQGWRTELESSVDSLAKVADGHARLSLASQREAGAVLNVARGNAVGEDQFADVDIDTSYMLEG